VSEEDNLPRWNGRPGAYEVWFLTASNPESGDGYWLRSTLHAPKRGTPYGAVWFARFDPTDPASTFGVHRRFGMDAVSIAGGSAGAPVDGLDGGPFQVRIGDSTIASGRAGGSLEGAGHEVRWDLTFPTGEPTWRLLPDPFYRGGLAPTKPYSPNPDTLASGTLWLDGVEMELRDAPAQQGHLVGARHAERWAWAHCSRFDDEEAVVQALTAQGRRGPLTTPYVTSVGIRWEGRWIRLSKMSRRRDFGLGTWRLDLGNRRYRLTGRIEAPARAMIRARYEDPDGSDRFCHNSEIASSRLALFERHAGGFEELTVLESRGTTHAEWAGRTPATSVEREHVEAIG
jgi:hypothetical protein